jgi:hypothetical protein
MINALIMVLLEGGRFSVRRLFARSHVSLVIRLNLNRLMRGKKTKQAERQENASETPVSFAAQA